MDGNWLDQHTSRAPAVLRSRVHQYVSSVSGSTLPGSLSAAADAALVRVLSHSGDRPVALDLLAADALITLALLAQAEAAPEHLEDFAIAVLRAWRSPA